MKPLRIGIDGRGFSSPAAGVRRYLSGLVPALRALDGAVDLVVLGGASAIPSGLEHVLEQPHPPTNLGWSAVGLPRAASRARVDVIHAPAYTAPLWSGIPSVVTIHDVSYERHPEWYPYRRDWLRRQFYRRSARAAAQVITDSQFSAGEITAAYAIRPERITVAPLGVSGDFVAGELVSNGSSQEDLPVGIVHPFLLHVGDMHERRNLPMLVRALLDVRSRLSLANLSLVLAGVDRGVGDSLLTRARRANASEAVVCLGTVTDDQLLALYRHAIALVYPSRYEGFGLPVLEAMAAGTPVIASRAASIPEVVGDAGILLDPDDEEAWSRTIAHVVMDEGRRQRMRAAGVARAHEFTWARTARITLDVYRKAAGTPRQ